VDSRLRLSLSACAICRACNFCQETRASTISYDDAGWRTSQPARQPPVKQQPRCTTRPPTLPHIILSLSTYRLVSDVLFFAMSDPSVIVPWQPWHLLEIFHLDSCAPRCLTLVLDAASRFHHASDRLLRLVALALLTKRILLHAACASILHSPLVFAVLDIMHAGFKSFQRVIILSDQGELFAHSNW
jgi:hypothetical protein